jgi:integrase
MPKSRPDFVQKPYYKKSHKAMYVDIDGKPKRLCKGDTLTEDGRALYLAALKEKGSEPEREYVESRNVRELVDEFLQSLQADVKKGKFAPRTYDWYFAHLNSFAKFIDAQLTIARLKPFHVQNWLDKKYANSGGTHQHGAVRSLSRVFNWARKLGMISGNPIAGFERPSAESRECYLTDEQWKQVSAMLGGDFGDLIWFLYLTGCRPLEARSAKVWHFENDCLTFERVNSKGKKSRRVILLEGKALAIVKRRLGGNYIFTNDRGNAWTSDAMNCRFARIKEKLGFEVFPYIFRHTFITNALKRGLNPLTVAALVGHADATMIMKTYSHLCQDSDHLRAELRRAVG